VQLQRAPPVSLCTGHGIQRKPPEQAMRAAANAVTNPARKV
jgi:hypothetical protein